MQPFLRQIIPQFPFTFPRSPSIPSSIQAAAWCVSHVQSELHLFATGHSTPAAALQNQGNILTLILPDSPKGDTLSLQILYEKKQSQEPLLALFVRRLVTMLVTCCFSLRVQGEYKRFWIDVPRASLIHQGRLRCLLYGFKGKRRIFLWWVSLHW